MGEDVASQTLDDLPPDPARIVIADVIAQAAQREQDHDADRHQPLDPRVLIDERALQEGLDQVDQPRLRRRKQDHAEHADHEGPDIRLGIAQQPQVDRPVITVRLGVWVDHGGDRAQGVESSCTVAMLSCAKPSRPATSMAVTTARWVLRASARMVSGPRSEPDSFKRAARKVSGLALMSGRSLTR